MSDITRGETITFGSSQFYTRGLPTGTWVYIEGESFLDVKGTIHSVCGYCGDPVPGVKSYHANVFDGVCFQCNGAGIRKALGSIEDAAKVAARRIKARERRAAKREAEEKAQAEERAAQIAEWTEAHPDLAARLAAIRDEYADVDPADYSAYAEAREAVEARYGSFLADLANQAGNRGLTEKQSVAAAAGIEKADLAAAERMAAEQASRYLGGEGDKVEVRGIVERWVAVEDYYSHSGGTKALVIVKGIGEHHGVTLKMIGTAKSLYDCDRGDEVVVAGTVKKHEEYEGIKQTQVIRPKVSVLTPAQEA